VNPEFFFPFKFLNLLCKIIEKHTGSGKILNERTIFAARDKIQRPLEWTKFPAQNLLETLDRRNINSLN